MKKRWMIVPLLAVVWIAAGCSKENSRKDRSEASAMFQRIYALTGSYTKKLSEAPDSADWAQMCREFEDSLDKINFSYPPDTDLLLTEGQNDSIHALLEEYRRVRDERIHEILHPYVAPDTIPADSVMPIEAPSEISSPQADASRSRDS